MLGTLNTDQINNILSSQVIGRLGCTDGKNVYVVPVTYTYDGQFIYGQTKPGKKLDILRKNPTVCFEIDVMTDMRNWQSILVYGTFQELTKEEAEKAREILFNRIYTLATSATIHSFGHEISDSEVSNKKEGLIMYKILIDEITGRFEKT